MGYNGEIQGKRISKAEDDVSNKKKIKDKILEKGGVDIRENRIQDASNNPRKELQVDMEGRSMGFFQRRVQGPKNFSQACVKIK